MAAVRVATLVTSSVLFCSLCACRAQHAAAPVADPPHHGHWSAPTYRRWQKTLQPVPKDIGHEVVFGVHQVDADKLEQELMAVSTPGSPRYGKHLTFDEVGELIGTQELVAKVEHWALQNIDGARVVKRTPRGEYVRVNASVAALEKAFSANFSLWSSTDNRTALRSESFVMPESLSGLVDFVHHIVDFPLTPYGPRRAQKRRLAAAAAAAAISKSAVTPAVLNHFYRIDSNRGSSAVSQAVFETVGETYSPRDLALFQQYFGLATEAVATVVGGHADSLRCDDHSFSRCGEADLDVQYLMAVARATPTTYYYTQPAGDVFLAFVESLAAERSPPLVNSVSYSAPESELLAPTMAAFNVEVMKLGLMGVSVFAASGDGGAPGQASSPSECAYEPQFPASSPYVTAVGATFAASWANPGKGEVVCQSDGPNKLITSGGGFSGVWPAPAYQAAAIAGYFERVATEPVPGFARGGRGYPDLALSGSNYQVVIGGGLQTVSGTSASTPSVAGMASLVNAVRREAGAPPLGFLNPAIYAHAGVFNDITSGSNMCTRRAEVCCREGFYAAEGWDPTTGFGSVDFAKFKAALLSDLDTATVRAAEARLAQRAQPLHNQVVLP